jgi:hypothetical protein
VHTIEKTEALLVSSNEIGLKVNADKTKYVVMFRNRNAGSSHNIMIDNCSFEKWEDFKHLGKKLISQNSNQEELRAD